MIGIFNLKTTKPTSATHEGWEQWRQTAKKAEPIRYFLNETLPDFWYFEVLWWLQWPYKTLKVLIRTRITKRWHIVNTHLKPEYYEPGTLVLHASFALLEDFVEVELAGWMGARRSLPFWKRWLGFEARSRELGLKYLEEEIIDSSVPGQAECAVEKKALYLWWKDVRPNRPDPDAEYSALYDQEHETGVKVPREEYLKVALRCGEIEQQQYDEDNEMLKRLISVRRSLWT